MASREAMYDQLQTERQLGEAQAKVIQDLAAEIEELQRFLALAEIRIEELQAKLNEAREDPHG